MVVKTGLLICSNPNIVYNLLCKVYNDVGRILYVQLVLKRCEAVLQRSDCESAIKSKALYRKFMYNCYKCAIDKPLDIRVLLTNSQTDVLSKIATLHPIDIVYFDQTFSAHEMYHYYPSLIRNKSERCEYVSVSLSGDEARTSSSSSSGCQNVDIEMCNHVVIGGTFDRLHNGHKILLSEAVLRCQKKLTVGVTDNSILDSKILPELIAPCEVRMAKVKGWLADVEPNLEYDVLPIYDIYGPTKDNPLYEMIIVSEETIRGAEKINEVRKEKGLNELKIVPVALLQSGVVSDVLESKVSSSNARIEMLGSLLSIPKPKPRLKSRPYVVGLTGGIASGKTAICEYLAELGAKCIVADKIGHEIYSLNETVRQDVIQAFGTSILDDDGAINRRKLGNMVFNGKDKLNRLNGIVWPAILHIVKQKISEVKSEVCDVVVLEAAVLIQARWEEFCHEIWSSIIPKKEAIKRLRERNNLTEEEAIARISVQPTNEEYVSHSNVIFSSLWDKTFTQKQVQRAWHELHHRIPPSNLR